MIFPCACKNTYQDRRYGANKRVGNIVTGAASANIVLRCTSCKDLYYTQIKGARHKASGERKTRIWFESAASVSDRFSKDCRYKRN